ncbi:MAG: hypothetical protein IPK97_20825 [Ahniella sp.]|nr:hypothetical protein [Ahniella sp.]
MTRDQRGSPVREHLPEPARVAPVVEFLQYLYVRPARRELTVAFEQETNRRTFAGTASATEHDATTLREHQAHEV